MYVLNDESENPVSISRATILLTRTEASELRDALETILNSDSHHEHVSSADFQRELTVSLFEEQDLASYDPRIRKILASEE